MSLVAFDRNHAQDPAAEIVAAVLRRYPTAQNPYVRALTDGTMTRAQFAVSQAQFGFAVDHFSRPMAVLAARFPRAEDRLEILHNVWEEHGEGDLAFHHGATFRAFLKALGGAPMFPEAGPAVTMFNATLSGICANEDPYVGVGMLGMIERMFAEISASIGSAVVARGWVAQCDLVHYATHEALDIEHAEEFFDVARRSWVRAEHAFEQGAWLGAYAFDALYRGLR